MFQECLVIFRMSSENFGHLGYDQEYPWDSLEDKNVAPSTYKKLAGVLVQWQCDTNWPIICQLERRG